MTAESKICANCEIDWTKVFALDCSFTVPTISGGRWTLDIAERIARHEKTTVRDKSGRIVRDYRE